MFDHERRGREDYYKLTSESRSYRRSLEPAGLIIMIRARATSASARRRSRASLKLLSVFSRDLAFR
jgi:hypothetical protein